MLKLKYMSQSKFPFVTSVGLILLLVVFGINSSYQTQSNIQVYAGPPTKAGNIAKHAAKDLEKIGELLAKLEELIKIANSEISDASDASESIFKILQELEGLGYDVDSLEDLEKVLSISDTGERTLLERAISRIPKSDQACFQDPDILVDEIKSSPLTENEILLLNNQIDKAETEIEALNQSLAKQYKFLAQAEKLKVLQARGEAYYTSEAIKIRAKQIEQYGKAKDKLDDIIKWLKNTDEVNINELKRILRGVTSDAIQSHILDLYDKIAKLRAFIRNTASKIPQSLRTLLGSKCLAKPPTIKTPPTPTQTTCSKIKDSTAKLLNNLKNRFPRFQNSGLSLGVLGRTLQRLGIAATVHDLVYDSAWEKGYRKLLDLERRCIVNNSKPCLTKANSSTVDLDNAITFTIQSLGGDETGPILSFLCTGDANKVENNARARVKFLSDPVNGCDKEFQKAIDEDENLKYFLAQIGRGGDGSNLNPISPEEVTNGCNLTDAGLSRLASLLDELNTIGDKIENKDSQCVRVFANKKIADLTPPYCLYATYNIDEESCEKDRLAADEAWNKFSVKNSGDDIIMSNARDARNKCMKLNKDYGKKIDEMVAVYKDGKLCRRTCASFGTDSTKCIQNSCKWDGASCSDKPINPIF